MLTGNLRQVVLNMNKELRTYYKDFNGQPVVPFIYDVITCPKCLFSSLIQDFDNLYNKKAFTEKEKNQIKLTRVNIIKDKSMRDTLIQNIKNVDFNEKKIWKLL